MRDGHPPGIAQPCPSLGYGTLVRARLQDLDVGLGEGHEAEVCFLYCAIGVGERRRVIRDPPQKFPLVLNRGDGICGKDHIEPGSYRTIGAALRFARVVRRQHQELARPAPPHPLQAAPEELGPCIGLSGEIGSADRLHEQSQVRKSRRTEARTALLDLAAREERFFSTNSAYTNVPANLGYAGTFPAPVGSSYYQVNVTNATGTCVHSHGGSDQQSDQ